MASGNGAERSDDPTRTRRRLINMAKVLNCGDVMLGCKAVIEGKDEAEVPVVARWPFILRQRRPS